MSTWLITGDGRGLGAHLDRHALVAGHDVVATARNADAITVADDRLLAFPLDITDADQAQAAAAAARAVFDTNVFGALNVLRAVLPGMGERRAGRVINISSVGGFAGSAGCGIYNATKFAVQGFSEALALESAHLGI